MFKTLIAFILLMPAQGFASTYLIEAQVFVNGRLMSNPRVGTSNKTAASISQTSERSGEVLKFSVLPSSADDAKPTDPIPLKIDFKYTKGTVDVSETLEAKASLDHETSLPIGKDGKVLLKLKISEM